MSLTEGALARVMRGEDVTDFVVQVLGAKPIQSSGQDRYRLLVSDGAYSNSFSMLATQLNHLIQEKKLENFTIIKIKKHICNQVTGGKTILILMEIEVITPGAEVGRKIGSPVQIPSDGSAPPPPSNQNKDPNVGAVKRPAETSSVAPPPAKVPANNSNRSVLGSKPSTMSATSGSHVVSPICSITPYQNKWTIKARVTSKSDIRTWNKPSGSGKLFSLDLMDDSGEIRATAFKDQCDQYYDLIQVGKVYYISRCNVKAANKAYSKLKNDYELTFKDDVLVEPVEDAESSDVPTMSYDFAKISDLAGAAKDSIVDVLGVCKENHDTVNFTTKAGKELTKREILLCDSSNAEVMLTLWGSTAESFQGDGYPVIAIKGARVGDYNGITLSGGDLLLNPELEQATKMRFWWDESGGVTNFTSLTVQGQRGGAGGGGVDSGSLKSLAEVKLDNLGYNSDRGEYYSAIATVTYFTKDKSLYKACPNQVDGRDCNKKMQENGDGTYRCEKCSTNLTNYKWRLILSMNIGDYSEGIWSTCFQETAEKMLGMSSEEVGNLSEQNEERFNAVFAEASFKTYAFRMRAKADTYNDETRVKHTVVGIEDVDYIAMNKMMIKEIEAMGGLVPDSVNRAQYA